MAETAFSLVDLVDFEAQMARDLGRAPEQLNARDDAIRRRIQGSASVTSSQLVLSWLHELKFADDENWPGQALVRSLDIATFLAALLGLLSGSGLVRALLIYDGTQPVNVIPIVAIYVILQLVLLLNYIFKGLVYRLFRKLPGSAMMFLLREWALNRIESRSRLIVGGSRSPAVMKAFGRRIAALHPAFLQNIGWKLFQTFGIAAHAASLVTLFGLVFFNDFTFGWRTTLHLDPKSLHAALESIAWPFRWLGPYTLPDFSVVESSQFSRYQDSYISPAVHDIGARSTAAWWPFLALCIFTYGLIPRIILWLLLNRSVSSHLRNYAFDDFQSLALIERLRRPEAPWSADGPLEPPAKVPNLPLAHRSPSAPLRHCILFRWRGLPIADAPLRSFLETHFGLIVRLIEDGEGRAREAGRLTEILDPGDALVVAADPWELPGEALDRIRKDIRAHAGAQCLILFAPLDIAEGVISIGGDRVAWQHALQNYRDPYVGLLE